MEYRILGPLEVVDEGEPVPLGRLKERLVLAILLLHANEFVPRERLIDELWGEAPPPTAKKAVNVYVSQLRKALARNGHDPITTADGGYRLEVDDDGLDVSRLRQLLATARERATAGDPGAAAELLREALGLWRGPTLAGLLLESHGRDEIAQLDELRLTALMDRIDCDIALGRHEEVLGELQVLVGEHRLRERLRAQQMLALYRADRQAEALDGVPASTPDACRGARDRAEPRAAAATARDPAPRPVARDPGGNCGGEWRRAGRGCTARDSRSDAERAGVTATPSAALAARACCPRDPCGLGDGRNRLGLGRPIPARPIPARRPEQPRPARPSQRQADVGGTCRGRAWAHRIHAVRDLDGEPRRSHGLTLRPPHASSADARRFPASALRRRRRHGRERLGLEQDADRDTACSRRWGDVGRAAVPVEDGDDPCPWSRASATRRSEPVTYGRSSVP